MTNLTDEDKSLFLSAMDEVQPIKSNNRLELSANPSQPQIIRKPKHKTRDTQSAPSPFAARLETSQAVSAFENLRFCRPSLDSKDFKKLQKGNFNQNWQLDLHGMTEGKADQALRQFLQEAIQLRARYLLIVHGKGYNSDLERPKLKNLVNQRLKQVPQVLAFCSAQPKDGGTGAVYVFLKQVR